VSDRFVELTPAYTSGPTLTRDAVIPMQRSIVPLELDQVYSAVDDLSKMLGPAGANTDGQLSAALHALAQLANGNGADVHSAITSISAALPALTNHPDQLQKLIGGLDSLTKSLAQRNNTINALYGDLATATSDLAGDRQTIASAVTNLQAGLSEVAAFIKANQSHIKGSVANLTTAVQAVMSQQESLIKTFDVAPLGFQNFDRAFDTSAACPTTKATNCTALFARVDLTQQAFDLVKTYCGNSVNESLLPVVLASAKVGKADAADTVCAAEFGLLQKHHGVPGAPSVDLDLAHYLGS